MHNAWNTDSDGFNISIPLYDFTDLMVDNLIMDILDQPAFLLNDLTNQISDRVCKRVNSTICFTYKHTI
ncbi:hypothetical protein D3C74_469700 [compost metagenome]